jgi:hypothetical protein
VPVPQPYLTVSGGGSGPFQFTADAISKYPKLVIQIGLVVANWSYVDLEVQWVLAQMLGTKGELVAAIYRQIQAALSRDALVQAVAEQELTQEDLDLFRVIWKLAKSPNQQRNKVAHGVWGIADDVPDALVMINPLDSLQHSAKLKMLLAQGNFGAFKAAPGIGKHLMAYRENDFDALNEQIILIRQYWSRFRGVLVMKFPEGLDEWRQRLCDEPPIRAELDKLVQDRQNST